MADFFDLFLLELLCRWTEKNSDGSSGSRSSSATPECPDLLDSRLSKTSLENLSHATLWTTSASSDNRIENMGSRNQLDQILPQSLSKISALPSDVQFDFFNTKN